MSKIVLAVLMAILLLLPTACTDSSDIKVYSVLGSEPGLTYNVLFLGDGFNSDVELDTYRAAVNQLAVGLLERAPFCYYEERLNFYRIDVRDPGGTINEEGCDEPLLPDKKLQDMYLPLASHLVSGKQDAVRVDLEATRCWDPSGGSGLDSSLWLGNEGLKNAYTLAAAAPSISLVVVLLNFNKNYGAGYWEVWPGSIGLLVLGLEQVQDNATGEWLLSEFAHQRFAHEFGHGLGLLDEYEDESVTPLPIPDYRNVWSPGAPLPITASAPAQQPFPWPEALEGTGCTPETMAACCAFSVNAYDDEPCSGIDTKCAYVPAVCQDSAKLCLWDWVDVASPGHPTPCYVPKSCLLDTDNPKSLQNESKCATSVGAWEGANYMRLGVYRARQTCRMRYTPSPFCEACAIVIRKQLCAYGSPALLCPDYTDTMESCPP